GRPSSRGGFALLRDAVREQVLLGGGPRRGGGRGGVTVGGDPGGGGPRRHRRVAVCGYAAGPGRRPPGGDGAPAADARLPGILGGGGALRASGPAAAPGHRRAASH